MPAPSEITPEEWQRIVAVFAKHKGRIQPTSAELGWPYARAARRWKEGYPSLGYPPIKTMLAHDEFSAEEVRAERMLIEAKLTQVPEVLPADDHARAVVISTAEQARIHQMVRREEERSRARQDAVKSRAAEATLVSINRGNAIALNAMTAAVLRGATILSQKIQKELESEATNSLSLQQKMHLVRAAASIARFNSEATVMAVKAERLVLGAPIEPDEDVAPTEIGNLDEAAEWIAQCTRALTKAHSRGLIAGGTRGK